MTKSRRMTWAGHIACIGKRNAYRILVGKPKRINYEEHLDTGGRIMSR
jgi:hypothetical protein